MPESLQQVLATAMSRDPRRRYPHALDMAEALRVVQTELGLAATPLEIVAEDWAPPAPQIDFADVALRGPGRSQVAQESTRRAPARVGIAALARDEDEDISRSIEPRRPMWPWLVGGLAVLAFGVLAGIVGALVDRGRGDAAPRGRRALITGLSVIAVLGVVVGVSVVWPGLDAREVPPAETSLWALQTGDGRRYARVNTAVGELDTVRDVGNPSALAQSPAGAFLFSESFGRVTRLDEAQPADVVDDVLRESPATPAGTTDVAVAGDFVAYRTDTGAVWTGALGDPSPAQVAPDGGDAPDSRQPPSPWTMGGCCTPTRRSGGEVLRYDIAAGQVRGRDPLDTDAEDPALTAASGAWFLLDRSNGDAWQRGADAGAATGVDATAVVSVASSVDDAIYIADQSRLIRWEVGAAQPEIVAGGEDEVRGAPARPVTVAGVTYAAWLPETGGGTLWSSAAGETALDFAGRDLGDQRRPVFLVSGGPPRSTRRARAGCGGSRRPARADQPGLDTRRSAGPVRGRQPRTGRRSFWNPGPPSPWPTRSV